MAGKNFNNKKSTVVHLIILSILVSFPTYSYSHPHRTSDLAVYMPFTSETTITKQQGAGDSSPLADACNSGLYTIVILGFVSLVGGDESSISGLTAKNYNFDNDIALGTQLQLTGDDISACQAQGIKVLLSIGGPTGNYTLFSAEFAIVLADALWNTFLGGNSSERPFGNASFDGIDFFIRSGSNQYYDELAIALSYYSTPQQRVYLSASPQCPILDPYLDSAIRTRLFDYVWVNFYNNSQCDYRGGSVNNLLASWRMWTTRVVHAGRVLMGLPADPAAATGGGYMPPQVLISQVLPIIKRSPRYGGVMVWNYFFDNGFSQAIVGSI